MVKKAIVPNSGSLTKESKMDGELEGARNITEQLGMPYFVLAGKEDGYKAIHLEGRNASWTWC